MSDSMVSENFNASMKDRPSIMGKELGESFTDGGYQTFKYGRDNSCNDDY